MKDFSNLSIEQQRLWMAKMMNLNPNDPNDWPLEILDRLIFIQLQKGHREVLIEINRLMGVL